MLHNWSPDGTRLVFYRLVAPGRYVWKTVNVATRQVTDLISDLDVSINSATLSPDLRWVAFHIPTGKEERLYVAPVREWKAAGRREWIEITQPGTRGGVPWWSPDSNRLFYVDLTESTGGFIVTQRLDPLSKRPVGDVAVVLDLQQTGRITNFSGGPFSGGPYFGPAVSRNRFVFGLTEYTGNVWLADLE
jgi:hypothetical protein